MRKNINKLATLVMTGALAATMSFAAFAEGEVSTAAVDRNTVDGPVVKIAKDVTTDGKTMAPKTSFRLEVLDGVKEGSVSMTGTDGDETYYEVEKGKKGDIPTNLLKSADFDPAGTDLADTYSAQFEIDLTSIANNYTHAGVYSYQIKEVTPTGTDAYEGVDYDGKTYDMFVFVVNKTNDQGKLIEGFEIKNVIVADGKTKISTIKNNYGKEGTDIVDKIHDLTISKAVTGNGANLSEKFTFNIKVSGATGEMYKVYLVEGEGNTETETEKTVLTSGTEAEFKDIQNGTKLRIYGLSESDTVSVREAQAGSNGYKTSYVVENNGTTGNKSKTILADADVAATANAKVDKATLTITNDKEYVTPTGVAMDIAPYALMVALAGGAAATFLRKKESFED